MKKIITAFLKGIKGRTTETKNKGYRADSKKEEIEGLLPEWLKNKERKD
jgi:hypothetical protein